MRLINAVTLHVEEFIGGNTPPYTILSHTWGAEEISLQDFRVHVEKAQKRKVPFPTTAGFQKVLETCKKSIDRAVNFCWIDTVCIDKTSSAELTESINSMYRWYAEAEACLVHLEDYQHDARRNEIDITHCRWFTRGWCLQELLAPQKIIFFDSSWKAFADKKRPGLTGLLAKITGIDIRAIDHSRPLSQFTIACRMSWASQRKTTRLEDEAYCLLGILEVNMPMLYGEGQRAFSRLQQEVIRTHDDPSFLMWNISFNNITFVPAMAQNVRHFQESRSVEFIAGASRLIRPSFTYTSRGVLVTSPNLRRRVDQIHGTFTYVLRLDGIGNVTVDATGKQVFHTAGIELSKVGPATYRRLPYLLNESDHESAFPDGGTPEHQIYILDSPPADSHDGYSHQYSCIRFLSVMPHPPLRNICVIAKPRSAWDSANAEFFFIPSKPFGAYVKIYPNIELGTPSAEYFVLAVSNLRQGSSYDGRGGTDRLSVYAVPCHVWELYSNVRDDVQWMMGRVRHHKETFWIHRTGRCGPFNLGSFDVHINVETKGEFLIEHNIVLEWHKREPSSTSSKSSWPWSAK